MTIDVLAGFEWLSQLTQPLRTLNRTLSAPFREDSTATFKQFWLFPIVLASFLNLIVMIANHLPAKDPLFFSFYIFIVVVNSFLNALIMLSTLYIIGYRISISNAISIYSVSVIYFPLASIASLPLNYSIYAIISDVSSHHLGQYDSFRYFLANFNDLVSKAQINLGPISHLLNFLAVAAWLVSSILMAEALIQSFKVDDFSSYLSITMANSLSLIPQALAVATQIVVMFQLIQSTASGG